MALKVPNISIKYTPIVFLLFFTHLITGQNFQLSEPDISKLKEQVSSSANKEVIYHYLTNNYAPTSEKYDMEYYEWDTSALCAFKENFQNGIIYSVRQCEEAGGIRAALELPKTERAGLMNWIEAIYEVNKMDMDQNVWKENNSKFEPRESDPGCYFKIKEKESSTLVDLHCGC